MNTTKLREYATLCGAGKLSSVADQSRRCPLRSIISIWPKRSRRPRITSKWCKGDSRTRSDESAGHGAFVPRSRIVR